MKLRALLLACGILAPLLYVSSDIVASLRYEGYSYIDQTISEINAIGAPTRSLTIAFGLVLYTVLIAFGVGVWQVSNGSRGLRVAGVLLVVLGLLSLWAVPFASMQVRGVEQNSTHIIAGIPALLLLVTIMALAAHRFPGSFRRYTIATVIVFLAFGVWSGLDGPRVADGLDTPWLGIKERISVYSYQLWIAVFAFTLLRQRLGERAPRGISNREPMHARLVP